MNVHRLLGERIRFLRTQNGLTQARLADIVNSSAEFVSRIERGKAAPSIATAQRIADGLGVDIAALFDFSGAEDVTPAKTRARRIAKIVVEADDAVAQLLEDFVLKASRNLRGKDS